MPPALLWRHRLRGWRRDPDLTLWVAAVLSLALMGLVASLPWLAAR